MTDRRGFPGGARAALVDAPLAAEAQQAGKLYRVEVIAGTASVAEGAHHASRAFAARKAPSRFRLFAPASS